MHDGPVQQAAWNTKDFRRRVRQKRLPVVRPFTSKALVPVALACLLAGCPKRVDFGKDGPIQDPHALLALTTAAEGRVFSINGDAKIRVDSPQSKGVVSLFVAVSHPALIHLEALNFFGKPQSVLVSDGTRFGLYQEAEGKYYRGPASAENLSRFLPLVLPPAELTALMLGRAPRIPAESMSLRLDTDGRTYLLTLQKAGVTQLLHIDPGSYRVLRSEVKGVNSYDATFANLDALAGGVTYPRKVTLQAPAASITLELLYKNVEVNQTPDLTLYEMEAPANVPIVDVDEQGRVQSPSP